MERGGRLRKVGARARRGLAEFKRNGEAVLAEQNGVCARCGKSRPLDRHHRKARSQTDRGENPHAKSNLIGLCSGPRGCHALVTDHLVPDWREWVVTRKSVRA